MKVEKWLKENTTMFTRSYWSQKKTYQPFALSMIIVRNSPVHSIRNIRTRIKCKELQSSFFTLTIETAAS